MKRGLLGVVGQAGQVGVRVRGHMLSLFPQIISVHFMAPHRTHRVQQMVLVFAEAQNDVNTVDPAPDARATSLPQVVVVVRREAAIVRHVDGIQRQMHSNPLVRRGSSYSRINRTSRERAQVFNKESRVMNRGGFRY